MKKDNIPQDEDKKDNIPWDEEKIMLDLGEKEREKRR